MRIELQGSLCHNYRKVPKHLGRLLNFRGPCRRPLKGKGVYSHNCNKLNKNNMTSAKISNERVINSGISALSVDTSRNPYGSFKSQNRCQNPRSGLLCLQRQSILT